MPPELACVFVRPSEGRGAVVKRLIGERGIPESIHTIVDGTASTVVEPAGSDHHRIEPLGVIGVVESAPPEAPLVLCWK